MSAATLVPVTNPESRSQETRARLIGAAIDCLAERGYSGATTPVIARRAGVTRGAIQHHFPSRVDLDLAVIDHVAEALNFSLDIDVLKRCALEVRVTRLVDAYWATFGSDLFRAAIHIWLAVLNDPLLAARMKEHLFSLKARIEPLWAALFHDTGIRRARLRTLRHVVMGAARGSAVERLIYPQGTGRDERRMLVRMMLTELNAPVTEAQSTQSARAAPRA